MAILAGTVISTAVLTGALVVGDTVKYSLLQLTDARLGRTRFALRSGDRFFRQQLAGELSQQTKSSVSPVLQLEGIAINNANNSRINRVEVLGIDERFIKLWNTVDPQPEEDEAIINQNTAQKLNLKPGDEFLLKIHQQSKASENAPFISEKEPLVSLRLKIAAIADNQQMGRFSLKSNQAAPYNIFVSLPAIAGKLELTGKANLLLIADNITSDLSSQKLDSLVQLTWKPEDAGLEFRNIPGQEQKEIRSERIFIDDSSAKAVQSTIPDAKPVFTYLVNAISANTRSTPYSFVTATELPGKKLSGHEIIISDWLAADLNARQGDSLQLRFFKMGAMRKLTEDSACFFIKTILPIHDPVFDRTLMPDFPGMSDAGNCRDWETNTPVKLDKIREKDEQYWRDYRGTPKAFISMEAGRKLWNNAFGHVTAFRFSDDSAGVKLAITHLMQNLKPTESGFQIQDVYTEGKLSAANSTDFGSLFLSMSFFIIGAALLLIALLYSLHAQKRMSETALLTTLGIRKKEIFRILFAEAAIVATAGSVIGVILGILYNKVLLLGLNTLWQDAVRTTMLQTKLLPSTLLTGFAAGIITALLTFLLVIYRNLRQPLFMMIKGVKIPSTNIKSRLKTVSLSLSILLFGMAIMIMIYSVLNSKEDVSETFLAAGGMVMVAGVALLYALLLQTKVNTKNARHGFFALICKNISLKSHRTIAAIALLAIGTFSVIITGANRKTFYGLENKRASGTGGFFLWAETTVPLLFDLNSDEGREKYGISDEKVFENVHFIQMLSLDGNDASCLNLNQVTQPKILGLNPDYLDQQQAFSFVKLDPSLNNQHPWLILNKALSQGIIPAFADQTVLLWGMHKKIGDTLLYHDESGNILKVKIMGGLDNSVFQGNILISEQLFRKYFPSVSGSRVMLVDGNINQRSSVSERLEYLFQDYGIMVTPTTVRLEQFNSVENTYLSVFMLLGGLGVVLGTFGLGIVVLRSISERQAEMALYLAIGLNYKSVFRLLATEYTLMLLAGIFIGSISAFIGLSISIFHTKTPLPWSYIIVLLMIILSSGLLWIFFPLKNALKKNIIPALRTE